MLRLVMGRALVLVVVSAFLYGCTFRIGDLSVVSSENTALPITRIAATVEGEDCVFRLLGLIPISGSLFPNIEEAMDRAMEKVPNGNVMTSIAIYQDNTSFILASQLCTRVKGDVGVLQ
jgi:hypothetical protein